MPTPTMNDVLTHSLSTSGMMLGLFCGDLTPAEYLHRPCAGGNCAAWIVGHLVLTERSALKRVGVTELPPLPDGFETRFARDEAAPKADDYGDVSVLMPLFERHRAMLIDRVKQMPPEALGEPLPKPHPMFSTLGEAVNFIAVHVAMHAGQLTIIRRSLGRPPLI
jgi:uncharacterized damage-inducible protein DinB